jgi:hypothetical protein
MSAWAAIVAREATVTATAGTGLLHSVAPSAIDGFAVGTLLTGLCFIVAVAPRMRRPRLSGQPDPWPVRTRHGSKTRSDSYAVAVNTGTSAEPVTKSAGPGTDTLISTYSAASAEAGAGADVMLQPGAGSPGSLYAGAPAGLGYLAANYESVAADSGLGYAGMWSAQAEPTTRHALAQTVPAEWSFTPPPRTQFARPAGSHPYADSFRAPADEEAAVPAPAPEPTPAPDTKSADRSGYRSKHRLASPETDKNSDSRRNGPRHAARSARFTARRSARLPAFPLPARG